MTRPELTPDELRTLAAAGGAAPSLHNSQPWLFRPSADLRSLAVYADPRRAVPVADPDGRALHLSVGAALFNLRVAAVHLGREPVVRLPSVPPSAGRPGAYPLAVLDLAQPVCTPQPFGPDLYPAVHLRHSSRLPFDDRDVPEAVFAELAEAARAEGAELALPAATEERRIADLTAEAERRIAGDAGHRAETRGWLRPDGPADDGIPLTAVGARDLDDHVPMRNFTPGPYGTAARTTVTRTTALRAAGPVAAAVPPLAPGRHFGTRLRVATLTTRGDRPADWLRAGQALERVWLLLTVRGLHASVLHQAVEHPDTRALLRDPGRGPGHVQLVLRLGHGTPGPATPRRSVADVLDLNPVR